MSSQLLTAPTLTRAGVEDLSARRREPAWLLRLRLGAFEAFEQLPVPDQKTEGWRRTSLRGLPLAELNPLLSPDGQPLAGPSDDGQPLASPSDALARLADAAHFAFHNGAAVQRDAGSRAQVLELAEALRDPRLAARIEQHFGRLVAPDADKLTAMHYAFFNTAVVVHVPRGAAIEQPVWISHSFDQPGRAPLVHTLVLLDEGGEARVVEDLVGGSGVASGVVEQVVGDHAHLRYVQVQRWAPDVWSFSAQRAVLGEAATLRTLNVALGGRLVRNSIQVVLEGRGSETDLLGIVDGRDRQHVDFQTLQEHSGNATRSDLVIHDALRDQSSANFTGLIRINKSAHQTASSQEQKNILLSDGAKANSDPKLEILNNDVIRCTHGAAVGPVDEEMVFYLESRGLDRHGAEQLIVDGFFQSVLDKIQHPAVQQAVWSAIADRAA